jgi:hypothetical protein
VIEVDRFDIFQFQEREIEIAHELAQKVLMNEKMLSAASELCGELDW